MRKMMKRNRDRAVFNRTAKSTAVANLSGSSYRGGIRL